MSESSRDDEVASRRRRPRFCKYLIETRKCKLRAMIGFEYCIRHILRDTEAPFRQCAYVRNGGNGSSPNSQCLNVVRLESRNQYCGFHMYLLGDDADEDDGEDEYVIDDEQECDEDEGYSAGGEESDGEMEPVERQTVAALWNGMEETSENGFHHPGTLIEDDDDDEDLQIRTVCCRTRPPLRDVSQKYSDAQNRGTVVLHALDEFGMAWLNREEVPREGENLHAGSAFLAAQTEVSVDVEIQIAHVERQIEVIEQRVPSEDSDSDSESVDVQEEEDQDEQEVEQEEDYYDEEDEEEEEEPEVEIRRAPPARRRKSSSSSSSSEETSDDEEERILFIRRRVYSTDETEIWESDYEEGRRKEMDEEEELSRPSDFEIAANDTAATTPSHDELLALRSRIIRQPCSPRGSIGWNDHSTMVERSPSDCSSDMDYDRIDRDLGVRISRSSRSSSSATFYRSRSHSSDSDDTERCHSPCLSSSSFSSSLSSSRNATKISSDDDSDACHHSDVSEVSDVSDASDASNKKMDLKKNIEPAGTINRRKRRWTE